MTKLYMILAAVFVLWSPATMAQTMYGGDMEAEKEAARMNRDNYPYSVISRGPILQPQERRKLRQNILRYEQAQRAREVNKVRQFRAMSADERRYVIETQGFPAGAVPGYR